jgi:hypothetical protein
MFRGRYRCIWSFASKSGKRAFAAVMYLLMPQLYRWYRASRRSSRQACVRFRGALIRSIKQRTRRKTAQVIVKEKRDALMRVEKP